jgi:16S rRNA (guanine966-N2)-methyltransferase
MALIGAYVIISLHPFYLSHMPSPRANSQRTQKFTLADSAVGKKGHNRVRIIGGEWRSRVIEFPDALGLRPTPDRVRETLFNWLGQTCRNQHCLDLFAGSGALGFEAASRGATSVTMVEQDRAAADALTHNQIKLSASICKIIRSDALKFIATSTEKFDVIFVDPPFASQLMSQILPLLTNKLTPTGVIYAEWGESLANLLAQHTITGLSIVKQGRAGAVHFALLSAEILTNEMMP